MTQQKLYNIIFYQKISGKTLSNLFFKTVKYFSGCITYCNIKQCNIIGLMGLMWNDGDKQISLIKVPYLLHWGLWYLLENTTGTWLSLWEEANHEDHKSSSSPGLCREQLLCSPREVTLRQEMEELRQREKAELGRWYTLYTFPNIEVTCPTRSVTISISLSQYKLGLGSMILFGEKYNFSPLRTVRTFQLERRGIISISASLKTRVRYEDC